MIHKHPNLKHKFIAIIEIRAVYNGDSEGPPPNLMHNLYHHRDKLQHYHKIKIVGQIHGDDMLSHVTSYDIELIAKKFKLQGVVALDMSLPVGSSRPYNSVLTYRFSSILPNLRELDLSNTRHGNGWGRLCNFFKNCPCLEKLTWNNIDLLSWVNINGAAWMKYASNLKELYMDDSAFIDNGRELEDGRTSDLENEEHAGIFLFYECTSKVLERVSIKNAKYGGHHTEQEDVLPIPQPALIKYIRNAPTSLRWFRSDLSDANIRMLQHERPDIEFTN